jgi:putative transposase
MDERHLLAAARYVAMNPVKAGLVKAARDWPWSSARTHLAGRPAGAEDWDKALEQATGRTLAPARRGPKPRAREAGGQVGLFHTVSP